MDWRQWLDSFGDKLKSETRSELENFMEHLERDGDMFIRERGKAIAGYLGSLAKNEITRSEFVSLMLDEKALLGSAARVESAQAAQRARRLAARIALESFGVLISIV